VKCAQNEHTILKSCASARNMPQNNAYNEIYGGWISKYEGWNFNSGNYLFTTDTK